MSASNASRRCFLTFPPAPRKTFPASASFGLMCRKNRKLPDLRLRTAIDVRIRGGPRMASVGPTGSGSTTLVSLVPRSYDAEPGSVLIDGRPVRDYALADLRRDIGFVPPHTFLCSETVGENIAFA